MPCLPCRRYCSPRTAHVAAPHDDAPEADHHQPLCRSRWCVSRPPTLQCNPGASFGRPPPSRKASPVEQDKVGSPARLRSLCALAAHPAGRLWRPRRLLYSVPLRLCTASSSSCGGSHRASSPWPPPSPYDRCCHLCRALPPIGGATVNGCTPQVVVGGCGGGPQQRVQVAAASGGHRAAGVGAHGGRSCSATGVSAREGLCVWGACAVGRGRRMKRTRFPVHRAGPPPGRNMCVWRAVPCHRPCVRPRRDNISYCCCGVWQV